MTCRNPGCMGNYDFDQIAYFARKRFVEGVSTLVLLEQAHSDHERQEIALVSLLDVEDDRIRDLRLSCVHADQCKVFNCRTKLKKMIQLELDSGHPVASL